MSSLSFFATELQSLVSETRRKHPDVREAADQALIIIRESGDALHSILTSSSQKATELLRPLLLALPTRNAKVVGIALGTLQRLVTLRAISQSAVNPIANALRECVGQSNVDVQLRVLQIMLSLITGYSGVYGKELANILFVCFKLQESRIAVVSSTAAATLRQLVMFTAGDRVIAEDSTPNPPQSNLKGEATLPDGKKKILLPAALDAYHIFEDLCLITNGEKSRFLQSTSLPKTLSLELVESILTNCHEVIRKHPEQMALIRQHLCPFLLKSLSDRPSFALTLRSVRVLFLLLKQFQEELEAETEMFMMSLLKIISGDHEDDQARPHWLKVIAMEIVRGLCSDAEFTRRLFILYDSHSGSGRSHVYASLITALNKVTTEKPSALGVSTQIFGLGVTSTGETASNTGSSTLDGMGNLMANAASVTAGMVGMGGQEAGLGHHRSSMKLQCIDQLDKADAPPIPETYIYLLALQSLVALTDGYSSFVLPLYNTLVVEQRRLSDDKNLSAPPAIDLSQHPEQTQLKTVNDMLETTWHGFLASLSFLISTKLSDELFADLLTAFQNLITVSGALGLVTARDAFLTGLSKFAVPPAVVSALESYAEPPTPRTAGVGSITDNLGLTGAGAPVPPGLSPRNLACLKVLVSCSLFLAGSLGKSWLQVLETLQNADYVLVSKGPSLASRRASTQGLGVLSKTPMSPLRPSIGLQESQTAVPTLLADLDLNSVQASIQRLFDASRNLEDAAFTEFLSALCQLSREMVEMQSSGDGRLIIRSPSGEGLLTPGSSELHRRRASGIHLPKTLRSGDFGVSKLSYVCTVNVHRLVYRSGDVAWTLFVEHLLAIVVSPAAPASIRLQAAHALDDVLVVVPRNVTSSAAKDLQRDVQNRVFDVLARQNNVEALQLPSSTGLEIRRLGLDALHQILQASAHTLVTGWKTIFEILSSVCSPSPQQQQQQEVPSPSSPPSGPKRPRPLTLTSSDDKSNQALVRLAFQSVTLICDTLTALDSEELRLCITTLGLFGKQADTNIALTAAASLLWSVSDAIQFHRKDQRKEQQYDDLWMSLLIELLGLCPDPRPEVRVGAIRTLFRSLQLYGESLTLDIWNDCLWKVVFPLIDSLSTSIEGCDGGTRETWDESKTLAFAAVGDLFHDFYGSKFSQLPNFFEVWDAFVDRVERTFVMDNSAVVTAAIGALTRSVNASVKSNSPPTQLSHAIQQVWKAVKRMGEAIANPSHSDELRYTQESLLSFIQLIIVIRPTQEWPSERVIALLRILKCTMTYSKSPTYRPDIDQMTPVQGAVLQVLKEVDVAIPETAAAVLADVAEFATLAFVGAFDEPSDSGKTRRKLTYIGLCKAATPLMVEIFSRTAGKKEIYELGAVEKIISALAVPMKLKYDCPAPSKHSKPENAPPPLWKSATVAFLGVLTDCVRGLVGYRDEIPAENQGAIWHQIIELFRGALLADCSTVESWTLQAQEEEESFDRSLITAIQKEVIPHLGHSSVSDDLIMQLARTLQRASLFHQPDSDSEDAFEMGRTVDRAVLPRERVSYWCFDLLFEICTEDGAGKRVAALSILPLLSRCKTVLSEFIADAEVRGAIPFSRVREEEVLHVLKQMLSRKVWPGSVWAAYSPDPTAAVTDIPAPSNSLSPTELLSDVTKRGPRALLFQIYPLLRRIVAMKGKGPSAFVTLPIPPPSSPFLEGWKGLKRSDVVEVDVRELASRCLEEIGKEMGLIAV